MRIASLAGSGGEIRTGTEFSLSLLPRRGEGLIEMAARLAAALKELDAVALKLIGFGSLQAFLPAVSVMKRALGETDLPLTWVEGGACDVHPIAGIQVFAQSGKRVQRVVLNGRAVGSVFESNGARHCLLGGLKPPRTFDSRRDQAQLVFDEIESALDLAGFALSDVARTWFFLDDLVAWYGSFNNVRTERYSRTKFKSGSLPASTGVSARNPFETAVAAAVWAVQPVDGAFRVSEIGSPLQCPAPAYGSAFSRATEFASAGGRRLLLSGTASIAPGGESCWIGDAQRQIDLTMEVVEAILKARGFSFGDITRAIAYFKNGADVQLFKNWCSTRELSSMPVVPVRCGICRDDLLFELEADAWSGAKGNVTEAPEFAV